MRCPRCGARTTEPCTTKSGRDHPERTELLRAHIDEVAHRPAAARAPSKWDRLPGEVPMPSGFREWVRVASAHQPTLDPEEQTP